VETMNRKEHLSIEGLYKILSLRASMNLGLSPLLKTTFPDIIPTPRPIIESVKHIDPN